MISVKGIRVIIVLWGLYSPSSTLVVREPREIYFVLNRGVLDHGAEAHKRPTRVRFRRMRYIDGRELYGNSQHAAGHELGGLDLVQCVGITWREEQTSKVVGHCSRETVCVVAVVVDALDDFSRVSDFVDGADRDHDQCSAD